SSIDLSKLTPPVTGDLNSISLSDQNNGWAVGDNGVILRYDGQSWKPFAASPSTEKLNSVSAVDNVQAWIVGAYGTILRFNGTTWMSAGSSFSGFDLYRVLMRGESDGWAMGQDGNILYYDGSRWIPHPKPESKPSLNDLSFAGDTGFAVGQAGVIFKFESKGESPQFSFLFKGKVEPAKAVPLSPLAQPKLWTLTYTLLNEALAASPAVTFELKLPKDFKPYVEKATPTPTPLADLTPTLSPIPTPTPEIVHPGAVTGMGKILAQAQPQAMTEGWKLDGDKVRWDLGAVASSEIKTFSLRFEVPKNWDPRKNPIFKASLKSQDQDVADAAPVTLRLVPIASPSPTPGIPTPTATANPQP
ncbi:MAG: WD40/YVTN/BNR-like repeat-containing protein, partial [bacterium]